MIGVGWGAPKFSNAGSATVNALTSSSGKLLQVRFALGSYEKLFSVGKVKDGLLAAAHKGIGVVERGFSRLYGWAVCQRRRAKARQSVAGTRAALVDQAIEPEYKALFDDDFNRRGGRRGRRVGARRALCGCGEAGEPDDPAFSQHGRRRPLELPAYGWIRIAKEDIKPALCPFLEAMPKHLKALDTKSAQEGLVLTEVRR